jgi:hypothetical protein
MGWITRSGILTETFHDFPQFGAGHLKQSMGIVCQVLRVVLCKPCSKDFMYVIELEFVKY